MINNLKHKHIRNTWTLSILSFCTLLLLLSLVGKNTEETTIEEISRTGGHIAIQENKGQWSDEILYRLRMNSAQIDFKKNRLHLVLAHPDDLEARHHNHVHGHKSNAEPRPMRYHGIEWEFVDINPNVRLVADGKRPEYYNYFIGDQKEKWASNVQAFTNLTYKNIYPLIDLIFYEHDGHLKYDFIVHPGGNPEDIKIKYNHTDDLKLVGEKLHIVSSVNTLIEEKPFAYTSGTNQKRVPCHYDLEGNALQFHLPKGYDSEQTLVIDPELNFASYIGAFGDNWGTTATYDDAGALYAGSSSFGSFPTVLGAFQEAFGGGETDYGISKFSPDGTTLEYSTYIGGDGSEVAHSMIINDLNQLVILGSTSSSDFPTTLSAYDRTFNGGQTVGYAGISYFQGSDIAITVLSAGGNALIGSTYIGGSQNDGLINRDLFNFENSNYGDWFRGEVIVGDNNNIYVASSTLSSNIPIVNGFDSNINNGSPNNIDGYVFSLNANASSLRFATFIGGGNADVCTSMKLSDDGEIYITGWTRSNDFPTTPGVIKTNKSSATDAFVARLSQTANTLINATFLGENGDDFGYFVDIDEDDRLYILGQNTSANYDISGGVYSNPGSSNFIHCMDLDMRTTFFSTQIGNGGGTLGRLVPSAFLVDDCKRIYISGWGGQTNLGSTDIFNMPITSDALQPTTDGSDFYLIVLQEDAIGLEYATYFGGANSAEHVDGGTSRFSKEGIVYQAVCAGCGGNSDFPTTAGVVSNDNNSSNCNLGVFKLELQLSSINIQAFADPDRQGCAPMEVDFLNFTTGDALYFWDFDDGSASTEKSPTHTFTDTGVYDVTLIATGLQECVLGDTVVITVEVLPQLTNNLDTIDHCGDLDTLLVSSQTGEFVDYLWSDGSTGPSLLVSTSGTYWVQSDGNNGCTQVDSFMVTITPDVINEYDIEICTGKDSTLRSSFTDPLASYTWQDGSTTESLMIDEPGFYEVITELPGECPKYDRFRVDYTPPDVRAVDAEICEGDSILISGRVEDPSLDYNWNDGEQSFSREIRLEGTYVLTTTGDNFCTLIDSFVINYSDTFRTSTIIGLCVSEDTIISSSVPAAQSYVWNTGQTQASIRVSESGTYRVVSQDGNCLFLDEFRVFKEPIEVLLDVENIDCDLTPSGSVDIEAVSGIGPLAYSLDGINFQESTSFQGLAAGDYDLIIRDTFGCEVDRSFRIDTPIIVDVELELDLQSIDLGESTLLTADIDIPLALIDTIIWTPSEELTCLDNCLQQEVGPLNDQSYSVTAITVDGCMDIDEVELDVVFERLIYIPNVFSPNGDGINDLFHVFAKKKIIQNIHRLSIYDRWGSLVFDSYNAEANDASFGWDGSFKGEEMNPAVFVWVADIEYINGVRETYSGDLTLVR